MSFSITPDGILVGTAFLVVKAGKADRNVCVDPKYGTLSVTLPGGGSVTGATVRQLAGVTIRAAPDAGDLSTCSLCSFSAKRYRFDDVHSPDMRGARACPLFCLFAPTGRS